VGCDITHKPSCVANIPLLVSTRDKLGTLHSVASSPVVTAAILVWLTHSHHVL